MEDIAYLSAGTAASIPHTTNTHLNTLTAHAQPVAQRATVPLITDFTGEPGNSTWRLRKWIMRATVSEVGANTNSGIYTAMLKQRMCDLETIHCGECDGFGHTARNCATRSKLVNFSNGLPVIPSILSECRRRANPSHGINGPLLGKR